MHLHAVRRVECTPKTPARARPQRIADLESHKHPLPTTPLSPPTPRPRPQTRTLNMLIHNDLQPPPRNLRLRLRHQHPHTLRRITARGAHLSLQNLQLTRAVVGILARGEQAGVAAGLRAAEAVVGVVEVEALDEELEAGVTGLADCPGFLHFFVFGFLVFFWFFGFFWW
ncbi:hypothetical protein EJ03DRAFT_91831 [Teratosphaeria nubilosa]|uniref:Uncharacterized protein n=1 Tax=Teratosphaeria nubilosa TaxID=161662 RepID=A0A6G1L9R8_9PEZI|nr:hypothetical protein EJ03DRAFT_91831 [Teratosphaeria nubilosa]